MKRIGILTYHCIPNFGAQLQALSTIGFLKNHGYEPIVLNWYPEDLDEFYYNRAPKCQNIMQFEFSQKNMPVSRLCRTLSELCHEIENLQLDAIILGSDALFDYTPEKLRYNFSLRKFRKFPIYITSNHRLPNPFWGSFNDFLKKKLPLYGYAISSQNMPFKSLNSKEKREINRLLNGFNKLTVRDCWTKTIIEKIGKIHGIKIVPDPVFAFNQNFTNIPTKKDIISKFGLPDDYVLISFVCNNLSNEYVNNIIDNVEKTTGFTCVSFPMPDKLRQFKTQHTINLPLNPLDWYALIKYSKGYIGERMHPIVVCIHNVVPFFCFDQYGITKEIIPRLWYRFIPESSKIYDILRMAGLESNTCSYFDLKGITAKDVVEKFLSFSMDKCSTFSNLQLQRYNECMGSLLSD